MTAKTTKRKIPAEAREAAADSARLRRLLTDRAAGMADVITIGRGDPDLPTPAYIRDAAKQAARDGLTAPTPIGGWPELRGAIAAKLRRDNHLPVEVDNVIVTTGGEEGIYLLILALINPGDEVIVPDPRYTSYDKAIDLAGGKLVVVPTTHDDAFNLRPELIEAAITSKTKAILVVTPSNPTSGIVTEDRLREIANIAIKHNLIVIADELYENYHYDGWKHFSIGSLPGMAERTITLNGFSKTYIMTGLRVGYVAAPCDVIRGMERLKMLTSGPTATIAQRAAFAAITGTNEAARSHLATFTERRQVMLNGLRGFGLDYSDMRGAYYVWTKPGSIGVGAGELAYLMLQEAHVLIFPGTSFGENWRDYLRFSLVDSVAVIEEGLERMRPVIERYRVET